MALAPGSRLGRYEIVRQLGAGAMGEVYLAEDPHIERRLAIKTLRLDAIEQGSEATHTHLRMRIEREAKAGGRLVHPHIVTLFDAGEADGVFFLAFEFVDGSDLGARMRLPPPLTVLEIVRIGREVAAALDAAHRVGIIHRDIKPSNLLLTTGGSIKIADFGIAAVVGQNTTLTKSGSFIGTPHYVSPEQAQADRTIDGRSDLFSLGVVLYELLSGRKPFAGDTLASVLIAIIMKEPVPLAQLRPDLPPRLTDAVMRLLAKDPEQRFASAAALGDELATIEREISVPVPVAQPQPPRTLHETAPGVAPQAVARPRRGGMILAFALVAFVVISATVLVIQFARGPEPPPGDTGAVVSTETTAVVTASPTPAARPITETTASTAPEAGLSADRMIVGGVVTFRITPADAAERAVVRIDGLVRGLASGSMMTLRPGVHEIDVVAEGFDTERVVVESRADVAAASEIEVNLKRR